jgi:indole-3-glycerol phosphate synthase
MKPLLIAEVKTQSPFGFRSDKSWEELFEIANEHGDMLSIHTDTRWGGSFELLVRARTMTNKPILAKGIHATDEEIEQAIALGADRVLVVGRIPAVHLEQCFIEPYTLAELRSLPPGTYAVWNSRDLETGALKIDDFAAARATHQGYLIQASNIRTMADVDPTATAILVGQNLEQFIASHAKAK